jgi:hypothetical protein
MEKPWLIKLARAEEHLAALSGEVADYLDQEPARITVDRQGEVYELRLRVDVPPPVRWSAVLGDVLHNVRSALDSLVFALLVTSGTSVTPKQEHSIAFPIALTDDKYKGLRWHRGLASEDVRRAFRGVQPFAQVEGLQGLSSGQVAASIAHHPLIVLQRLSNADKHRTLHPTLCALDVMYVALPNGVTSQWQPGDVWPWLDGSTVAKVTFSEPLREPPEFGWKFAVALAEDAEPLRAPPMVDQMRSLLGEVEHVVYQLRQALPESGDVLR